MAANIPAGLRPAGITPFILRASQLESAKPVISYWCHYWAVNQILAKSLHNVDQDCLQFTTNLMDKLEQSKTSHADTEAIHNDAAGQLYVEDFAQETFERALRPLKANKVTQQTASTFEAASTFFQLLNIWGQADPETQSKIKYAKWNAARILRAIKEGRDPNDSNPVVDEATEGQDAQLEAEVQALSPSNPKPATVEDVPDDDASAPGSLHPTSSAAYPARSPAPVSAPTSPPAPSAPAPEPVSPEPVSPIAPGDQAPQSSEGYFPGSLPSAPSMPDEPQIPSAATHEPSAPPPVIPSPSSHVPGEAPSAPISPPAAGSPSVPQDYYRPGPPPTVQPSAPAPSIRASQPVVPTVISPPQPSGPAQPPVAANQPPGSYNADDMAMAQAQKHAKWAISALNFEDVPTAVRELKMALASLGAQ